jgi:hypothetical protein
MDVIQNIKNQYYRQDGAEKIVIELTSEEYEELLSRPLRDLQEIQESDNHDIQFVVIPDVNG